MSTLKVNSIQARNTTEVTFTDPVTFTKPISANQINGYARVMTATGNLIETDGVVYLNSSSGSVTASLPSLASIPLGWQVTVRSSDVSNTLTVAPQSGDSIVTLSAGTGVTLSSVGDYWTFEAGPSRWELVDGYETISGTNDGIKRFDGTMEQTGWDYAVGTTGTKLVYTAVTYVVEFNSIDTVLITCNGAKTVASGVPTSAMDAPAGSFEHAAYTDVFGTSPTTGTRLFSATINGEVHRTDYYYLISWQATGRWY